MVKISWLQSNNTYKKVEGDFSTVDTVPVGIYNIGLSISGWYLEKFADKFTFNYKMYGLQTEFCEHVLKTYKNTKGNFGIMLTGTKGTGKTVTAKTLANDFNLPVIIVKDMGDTNQAMIEFLSGFNFDCVLFFDEFEKNFSDKDSTILQIMDGVYSSEYRKIFLLTTNEMSINENLVGRPSRIRYVRHFGNLDLKTVEEYLDDALEVPEARQELIDFIDTLTISTIDILKTIVNEVNIHGMNGLIKAKEFFNVSTLEYNYNCYRGYCTDDIFHDEKLRDKFNVQTFLRDVDHYMNPMLTPKFMNEKDEDSWTDEERAKAQEFYDYRNYNFGGISYDYCHTNCRLKNLKIGNEFNEEEIVAIDLKHNVIITHYDRYCYFYLIKNPGAKPSLYGNGGVRYLDL